MAFPRKFNPDLDDLRLVIELIKERERLYKEAYECSDLIDQLKQKRSELKRQAKLLTCEIIADKFDLNKDVVYCIGRGISFKPEIALIDPGFYYRRQNEEGIVAFSS
jgi:hypothetical protein